MYSYKHISIVRAIWRGEREMDEPTLWTNPCVRALTNDEEEEANETRNRAIEELREADGAEVEDGGALEGGDDGTAARQGEEEKQDGGVYELRFWERHNES